MVRVACAAFLILIFFCSCERAISFTPKSTEPVVVVEGIIENGEYPVVYLSKSLGFFSQISIDILANSFIRNAEVSISNGTFTHKLKEYALPVVNGYTLYYYSIDSSNMATAFKGEFQKNYSLLIKVDGKEYSATTSIPALTKKIDSVWWEKAPIKDDSTKAILFGRTTDPPGFGNYIRYFTEVNGGGFFPGLNSVFDDQVVEGKTYDVQIEKGVDRNEEIDFDDYSFFDRGDTVTVKFANIDKACYDFWRTMEYSYSSIGNPFSSPTKVLSNIRGGGLGYFGGYAVQYISIVIPK
jgi:hypothetical protein